MGTDIAYRVSGSRKVINNNLFVQDVEKIICIVNNHIAEFYIKINSIQEVGLCPNYKCFFPQHTRLLPTLNVIDVLIFRRIVTLW